MGRGGAREVNKLNASFATFLRLWIHLDSLEARFCVFYRYVCSCNKQFNLNLIVSASFQVLILLTVLQ